MTTYRTDWDQASRAYDRRAFWRTANAVAVGGFLAVFVGSLAASAAIDALVAQCLWPGMSCQDSGSGLPAFEYEPSGVIG